MIYSRLIFFTSPNPIILTRACTLFILTAHLERSGGVKGFKLVCSWLSGMHNSALPTSTTSNGKSNNSLHRLHVKLSILERWTAQHGMEADEDKRILICCRRQTRHGWYLGRFLNTERSAVTGADIRNIKQQKFIWRFRRSNFHVGSWIIMASWRWKWNLLVEVRQGQRF